MQPIQINVSINIGLTQELMGFLSSVLGHTQTQTQTQTQATAPTPVVEEAEKPEAQPVEQPAEVQAEQPETAAPVEAAQENKVYTVVDVRAAMDRTRKRIEGENWKENPGSEGYKKWHRPLTAWFKNTAAICGAEKPSALPDGESCQKFVAYCDAVYVKDDELVKDCPF